jgi:hypothetical protein
VTQSRSDERTPKLGDQAGRRPVIGAGTFHLYQFFELGDTIDLERAQVSLTAPAARRQPPPRVRQSDSIQIAQPPIEVELGPAPLELAGSRFDGRLRASIYDLGAVVLAFSLPLAAGTDWPMVADLFAAAQDLPGPVHLRFREALDDLETVLRPAIDRPFRSPLVEDYSLLIVEQLTPPASAALLTGDPLVRAALLGERRPLSTDAAALVSSMSYYPDDLALLSWNGALVVEPDPLAAATVADLIEFANVELLLLRSYDADLEGELLRLTQRIASARGRLYIPLVGRYTALLRESQRVVIEVTEVTERIDNAFKVTDDVYWNRLYSALLSSLRVHVWRAGVEHRLHLLRETYGLLRDQADSDRSASLELIIILLILIEIVLALAGLW